MQSLYIFWFLHQTTTYCIPLSLRIKLYIFWFLHQTTTRQKTMFWALSCISFDSYIKPQPCCGCNLAPVVVYLLIPTSNHNLCSDWLIGRLVVYLLIPTSNHNRMAVFFFFASVVYLLIPTSNHNLQPLRLGVKGLYIFWFLHQTTTSLSKTPVRRWLYIFWFLHQTTTRVAALTVKPCCISFDSYIKPQRLGRWKGYLPVVYLLIPTSNHNQSVVVLVSYSLYIFWFLHQTTTYRFECTDFQYITITLSNKKWWVGYNF